jgi:diguanylate cyclase (GGDEF)-like protein
VVGRLGGEEFAILLEGSALPTAVQVAVRLRGKVAALRLEAANGPLCFTCSLGVSGWTGGDNIDRLLKRADTALYRAKRDGRNRVVAAEDAPFEPSPLNERSRTRAVARR